MIKAILLVIRTKWYLPLLAAVGIALARAVMGKPFSIVLLGYSFLAALILVIVAVAPVIYKKESEEARD